MNSQNISHNKILLKFIPILKDTDFNPVKDELMVGLDINFLSKAEEFIQAVVNKFWLKKNYDTENAKRLINNHNLIKEAALEDIKDIFSFLQRGERFCAGMFLDAFKDGTILASLNRLKKLMNENSD